MTPKELSRFNQWCNDYFGNINVPEETLEAAYREAGQAVLDKYGRHTNDCAITIKLREAGPQSTFYYAGKNDYATARYPCDCGFEQARYYKGIL